MSKFELAERQILDLYEKGSEDKALSLMLDVFQQPLYRHVKSIVLSHDDANDVLQIVWTKAWKGLSSFKGDSKLYSWLYRIASNECFTHLKKSKSKYFSNLDEGHINLKASSIGPSSDEILDKLEKALSTLPEKQRAVFDLKYFEDLKYDQISEILGTSVGGLKASYHHAVKKIEEFLKFN